MERYFDIDWAALFLPSIPLTEVFIRGSVTYLTIFILLRLVLKREAGTIGVPDLLLVVLLADAAQNAMAGEYTSITDGILLVGTILSWNIFIDWLSLRVPVVNRFVHPPPLRLIEDGRLNKRNMHREFISEEELMSQLRLKGIEEISEVKLAYMEGDGEISVITYNGDEQHEQKRRVT